jgi:Ca2+-binding RTX toxin-like protein
MAVIYGTGNADTINGISGTDTIYGCGGSDIIYGNGGGDHLYGEDGNDALLGGAGGDVLDGGAGDADMVNYLYSNAAVQINLAAGTASGGHATGDTLISIERLGGSNYADLLTGDGADNWFDGASGADTINGGAGADTASYAGSNVGVTVNLATGYATDGGGAQDVLISIENVTGSTANDQLVGDGAANSLSGGNGNDVLIGGGGGDTLNGGAGVDEANYSTSAQGVYVNLALNVGVGGDAEGDAFIAVERLMGSNYADLLIGDAGANRINGGGGDDTVAGGAGADTLLGGAGFDTVSYADSATAVTVNLGTGSGSGGDAAGDVYDSIEAVEGSAFNDIIYGLSAADSLFGGAGNDALVGSAGGDTLNGGAGDADMVNHLYSNAAVQVNLATGSATGGYAAGDILISIERLGGSNYADVLTGDSGDNWFDGASGADTINGGAGADTASYAGSTVGVAVNLAQGYGRDGANYTDTLISIENVNGSQAADVISGDAGNNVLNGMSGADSLDGGAGADTLIGGTGDDVFFVDVATDVLTEYAGEGTDEARSYADYFVLPDYVENLVFIGSGNFTGVGNSAANIIQGGTGDDSLTGGAGDDSLYGGAGLDTAVYAGSAYDMVFTQISSGWRLTDPVNGAGTDTLTGIEQAQFADRLIYLDGRNNAPILQGALNAVTNEDASTLTRNLLSGAKDFEGQTLSVSGFAQTGGPAAAVTVNGANFAVDPTQFNHLQAGETATLVFGYNVTDGAAATAQTLTVTIEGRDDPMTLSGSTGDDVLSGRSLNDTLTGGAGNDTLTGGLGADTFRFDAPSDGCDQITDFQTGTDRLEILSAGFDNIATGALSAGNFALDAATDADDFFIYDTVSKTLSYDADGVGVGAAISLAVFNSGGPSYGDIFIV